MVFGRSWACVLTRRAQLESAKLRQAEELLKQSQSEVQQFRCVGRCPNCCSALFLRSPSCWQTDFPPLMCVCWGRAIAETLSQRDTESRAQLAMYAEKFEGLQGTIAKSNDQFISFKKDSEKLAKRCKVGCMTGRHGCWGYVFFYFRDAV